MKRKGFAYLDTIACVLVIAAVCMAFTGFWPNQDNPYKSYSLQAMAWLNGRLDLGQDYPWLELAVFQERYYVSFPPFPSLVLLPLCLLFGMNTPDHWIMLSLLCISTLYAQKLYQLVRPCDEDEKLWVLFLIAGNGLLNISLQGWVWHMAQGMSFALSLMALYYARAGKGGVSLTCWMAAVGCRPMVVVYLPYFVLLFAKHEKGLEAGKARNARRYIRWCIGPILLLMFYMTLNQARFGSPFEFGHNYLPEFVRAEEGQFSLEYFKKNWAELFRAPEMDASSHRLRFYTYDCQAVWAVNPMLPLAALAFLWDWVKRKLHLNLENALLIAGVTAHMLIVLCHRTLGGWQFGNRYIVDILPFVFDGLLTWMPKNFSKLGRIACCEGIVLNVAGLIATYNHWI